ncbi:MAG TPA: complex I NDUFA9 subunit family protein [Beijerinckiaceae bacterium]|jgi:NADH dehydrogenase
MKSAVRTPSSQLVTVFGGSGFLGRHVVWALARRGYRIRVAVRRPDLAGYIIPMGLVGQIHAVQANLRYPGSVAQAAANADAVVNLVGILQPTGRQTFDAVQAEGAHAVAEAAPEGSTLVHVSAIGADPNSESAYARTKAHGETAAFGAKRDAIVMRPSVIFGPYDTFLNRFAGLARALPVLPLAGAQTRFQPVYAGDVAEAIARAVDGAVAPGRVYELGGPEVRTLQELIEFVLRVTNRRRLVVPLPQAAARAQATVLETLDRLTLGLMPDMIKLTRDQVTLLGRDNVVSSEAASEGRTLEGIGITPETLEAVAPGYLVRFRKTGQFDRARKPDSQAPDQVAPVSGGPGSQLDPENAPGPAMGQKAAG